MKKGSATKKRSTLPRAGDRLESATHLGGGDSAVEVNPRKKPKTHSNLLETDDNPSRRSSRANRGNGGQIVQLQNIERMQTQPAPAKVRPMDLATANEPLNPLAPVAEKQLAKRNSKGKATFPSETPAYIPAPKPMWRMSDAGSRYGFPLPSTALDSALSCNATVLSATHTGLTAPSSAPTASSCPPSRGSSGTPISRTGSVVPASRDASIAPSSQGSSLVTSRHRPSSTLPVSSVPLRSSQMKQRVQSQTRSLSRSSVHDFSLGVQSQREEFSFPGPPPHHSHVDEDDLIDRDHDDESLSFRHPRHPRQVESDVIDEMSPDEDDRKAEAVLRAQEPLRKGADSPIDFSSGIVQGGSEEPETQTHFSDSQIDPVLLAESAQVSGEDVVLRYHQRNGFPRAPLPEQLRTIGNQEREGSNEPSSNSVQHIAPDGPLNGSPTKLRSYPFKFREVIERAKLITQCDSATKDPFPARSAFLDVASTEVFNEALLGCDTVPPGYWPNYRKPLAILLWEALMTWRSTIKAKARETLPQHYGIGADRTAADNQKEAQQLIKGAKFLRDGVDDQGSTRNMAHPALAALIKEFFYAPVSLGSAFPEVFSREVPRVTVCLAATALCAALDEYTQSGSRQDRTFEFNTYSKIFTCFLDMQQQIDRNVKHAAKTRELQVAWASESRAQMPTNPMIAHSDEFAVVLD